MSNIYPKSTLKAKTKKDDSSTSNLRDPNIIFPQKGRGIESKDILGSSVAKSKTNPVMLRSFNKDISEAMSKKENLVSKKDVKISQQPKSLAIPVAPPVKSIKPIPTAPLPEKDVLKKEEVSSKKIAEPQPQLLNKNSKKESPCIDNIKPIESVNEKLKERKKFLLEIFPKPPQVSQKTESGIRRGAALPRKKNIVVDEKIKKKQKLHNDFDRMVHGEYDSNEDNLQINKLSKKRFSTKLVANVQMSDDDFKKLIEEIRNIETEEKELQSKLQELAKQEIAITKEENEAEAEKNLTKKKLDDILLQENETESVIYSLEKQAKETKKIEKLHDIETKRWGQEEKRAQLEKNKWSLHETYDKLLTSLKEKREKIEEIRKSKDTLNKRQDPLVEEKNQKKIKILLGEIGREKEGIENVQMSILEEKKNLDKTLSLLLENKQKVIEEGRLAEENEKKVDTISDKRIFEEKRQNIEIRRRSIEQQRWEVEQKLKDILERLKKTNDQYNLITEKEKEVK